MTRGDIEVVEINTCDYGSTGKIMLQIAAFFELICNISTFSRGWKHKKGQEYNCSYIGSYIQNGIHHILSTITGKEGCFSANGTKRFLCN